MMKIALYAALAALPLSTIAQSTAGVGPDAAIRSSIATINPTADIKSIKGSPVVGLREVVANGAVTYMTPDGRYLVVGDIIDVRSRENLTDLARAGIRADLLKQSPTAEHVVYKAKNERARVFVFTDVTCGFCQILHRKMPEYNALGITIEYLAFPRGGPQGDAFNRMRSIWCAADRNKAFDDTIAGRPVSAPSCRHPVANQYALGVEVGVEGTPAIYTTDGKHLGGMLEPAQLAEALGLGR